MRPLPSFISYINGLTFIVETSDLSDAREYDIVLTGITPESLQNPRYSEETVIKLTVLNGCTIDTITADTTVDDFTYYISYTGPQIIETSYTQQFTACPSEFGVVLIENGSEVELTQTQKNYLNIQIDGSLIVAVDNEWLLEGETWTVKLFKES